MKTLIISYSKYGQTRKIADKIAEVIESAGNDAQVYEIDSAETCVSLEPYEAVILGSPIYATRHSGHLGKFIKMNRDLLKKKRTAFFSVSLSAAGTEEQRNDATKCMDQFLKSVNWQPTVKTIFAGSLPYRKYNWFTRWLMKRVVRASTNDTDTSKDYEYTDWNRVVQFAYDFARPQSKPADAEHENMVRPGGST